MTRRSSAWVLVLVLGWASAVAQDEAPASPALRVERSGGTTRVEAVVPGRIVDYAFPSIGGGRRDVVVLVAPILDTGTPKVEPPSLSPPVREDAPRPLPPCPEPEDEAPARSLRLYRVEPDGGGGITLLGWEIPEDCAAVHAADLDGDGHDELVLGCEGELLGVTLAKPGVEPVGTQPQRLLAAPEVLWRFLSPPSGGDAPAWVAGVGLGRLTLYGRGSERGWEAVAAIELPIEGALGCGSLRIRSEIPNFLGVGGDGSLIFVTDPVAVGPRRLRTVLIEVTPSAETHVTECWSSLPESEDVLESRPLWLEGRPLLFVTTKPADKLNLFGEKRIRMFALERDRSRLGTAPWFAVESRMNLWQEAVPVLMDVNGDGLDDLVVGYWKGLVDDKIVLDAYLREPDAAFSDRPRTTAFDVEDGDRGMLVYGNDLDGDLLLYPGLDSDNGKRLVSDAPRVIPGGTAVPSHEGVRVSIGSAPVEIGSLRGRPRLVDLDGDGVPEIILIDRGGSTRSGVLRIVRLGPPA